MARRVFLNYAFGSTSRRKASPRPTEKPAELFLQLRKHFGHEFGCAPAEVRFAQNVTTHVLQAVRALRRQNPAYDVLVDSHEVKWVKDSLEKGVLDRQNMTRPDFARPQSRRLAPVPVQTIEPKQLVSNRLEALVGRRPVILVVTHVSRLDGSTLPFRSIYEKMKSLNPKSILIVDGAQTTGAMRPQLRGACDMYIGVTSKFVDAVPHLAAAYIAPDLLRTSLKRYPSLRPSEFAQEAASAVERLSHPRFDARTAHRIRSMRRFALGLLRDVKTVRVVSPKNQAPQIITLAVGSAQKTRQAVATLGKSGVVVSHNLDYSISSPTRPLIRVSIGAATTQEEIRRLVLALKRML